MGKRMSVCDNCAITEPSMYSTIEWMILCGCTTTLICSAVKPNSHFASITSSPLFIMVAQSIVIFLPIFHVGCFNASEAGSSANSLRFLPRNAPPEAVSHIFLICFPPDKH
jgi:hypothetical protein